MSKLYINGNLTDRIEPELLYEHNDREELLTETFGSLGVEYNPIGAAKLDYLLNIKHLHILLDRLFNTTTSKELWIKILLRLRYE